MLRFHQPRFGNIFYYPDEGRLRAVVEACIEDAITPRLTGILRALIVPHGTHLECGLIAGHAYKLLYTTPQSWDRVTLLAPIIQPPTTSQKNALLVEPVEGYPTPFDLASIDQTGLANLRAHNIAIEDALDDEPIIETQLPFMQLTMGGSPTLPLRVPAGYVAPPMLLAHAKELGLIVAAANLPQGDEQHTLHALQNLDTSGLRSEHAIKLPGLLGKSKTLTPNSDLATLTLALDLAKTAGGTHLRILFAQDQFVAAAIEELKD